ncbi:E3 SUMO-protein ligase ZNF451-like isoform X2 [Xenopus laevis]|uniref:E3 SUMO-protein ligase ZNF451-like isoform X2 n=1 Tax=Xenopus laevis TaxID=8355 RepID=A0A8J1KP63_XENLA|nr:E3 SUMO-protein ligase ZNF451-like isoform X2 [Xenopus laevis]
MSESNHFLRAIELDNRSIPCPVPFPRYAKNILVALCKDIPFQVKCSSCNQELRSHTELSAHFRTRCRNAHPVAYSEQSIAERKAKDHVDRQKDRVASTLDRLALHVEVEKKNKAEKNKAFQEKLHDQHAHGLQELEFVKGLPGTDAARICVNQWLKMPGLKPGIVCSSRRNKNRFREQSPVRNTPIICPIVHCNRKYDNGQLLLGHLKRFDHSPCDPTIHLHGAPSNSYACDACLQRFNSPDKYDDHVTAKARLADGHENNIPPQVINSFACPLCFLLFNLRDECLQHMSESNHFLRAIELDNRSIPCPVPFPRYAKNILVALCKDIPFQVKCSSCNQELRSHTELSAHFRTRCRNAHPVAYSEQSIAERKAKDHVDRQKDRVASTLDRLALHVEVEKKNKAEKNKAFQEKLHDQHAHGLQELEFVKGLPGTDAARICVNQWLKMPGFLHCC